MGGTVIVIATLVGYFASHLFSSGSGPTATGLLLLYLFTGMGVVGFLDDFIKVRKQRSLGLSATAKLIGQLAIGISFAVLALQFKDAAGLSPASVHLSYVRDIPQISFGAILFVVFAYLVISGTSNAVNLTDGLDGLCAGASAMVFGAYTAISFYQFRNACETIAAGRLLRGARPAGHRADRGVGDGAPASASCGGTRRRPGSSWATPARWRSAALLAGIAIVSRTELLLVVLGGLFVVETLSVIIQVAVFKTRRKRVFKMAPIHHHFELAGWAETTVIVRFWIIAGLAVAFGLGLFYAEFISYGLPG